MDRHASTPNDHHGESKNKSPLLDKPRPTGLLPSSTPSRGGIPLFVRTTNASMPKQSENHECHQHRASNRFNEFCYAKFQKTLRGRTKEKTDADAVSSHTERGDRARVP
jgi:hypothetical protein